MEAGLDALRRRFCDDEHSEGYEKVGPLGYVEFHGDADSQSLVRDQRYAAGLVQSLVELVEEKRKALSEQS